jgi:hypothetical protein
LGPTSRIFVPLDQDHLIREDPPAFRIEQAPRANRGHRRRSLRVERHACRRKRRAHHREDAS